eukprot:m.53414 g.53414  ORF g.53414 m.53414 type:complete len:346 (+) comp13560_c0_seq2:193-1230(+)
MAPSRAQRLIFSVLSLLALVSRCRADVCNANLSKCGILADRSCPDGKSNHPSHLTRCCDVDRNGCANACCTETVEPGSVTLIVVGVLVGLCCICPCINYTCKHCSETCEECSGIRCPSCCRCSSTRQWFAPPPDRLRRRDEEDASGMGLYDTQPEAAPSYDDALGHEAVGTVISTTSIDDALSQSTDSMTDHMLDSSSTSQPEPQSSHVHRIPVREASNALAAMDLEESELLGPGGEPPTYEQVTSQPGSRRGSISFQPFATAGSLTDISIQSSVPEPVAARLQSVVNPLTPPPGYVSPASLACGVEPATIATSVSADVVVRPSALAASQTAAQLEDATTGEADV